MKYAQYCMPIFFVLISIIYFILTINLPEASLGDPNAPRYFPLMVSVFLFVVSMSYLIQVIRKGEKDNPELKQLFSKRILFLSISTLVLGVIYSFLFLRIGFIPSTILFLGALLFVVNGWRKWMTNIIVAVVFSFAFWYAFEKLLHISLP
ncbi:MAG TPA: tripartite tricarboxylate transporter TctB family protein [Bacillales bacterium]